MTRKIVVSQIPLTNVIHGNAGVAALGIKMPITIDPNIILPPSRKKSASIFGDTFTPMLL